MNQNHQLKVKNLQKAIQNHSRLEGSNPISISNKSAPSNTTRGKRYKVGNKTLNFETLNEILELNVDKRFAVAEPRVTMEKLLSATLPFGLAPAVLPEFKGITVGGAIMGGAAESGSFRYGCFNDICISHELLTGTGDVLTLSSTANQDLYFGVAGSYGSLGALLSTKINLISVPREVVVNYQFCSPVEAIEKLIALCHSSDQPLFIDGLILSNELAVVIQANGQMNEAESFLPLFSLDSPLSPWFYQHVTELGIKKGYSTYQERMSMKDYFFRFDLGAFWMGAFLFRFPFLVRFIYEGLLGNTRKSKRQLQKEDIVWLHPIRGPSPISRAILKPLMSSKNLWKILHRAEQWCQDNLFIQDFCIPENQAKEFYNNEVKKLEIFPVWLCPIKGTREKQLFAPHFLQPNEEATHLVNFGLYGIPSTTDSIAEVTHQVEKNVSSLGGRKVFYSRSFYSQDEFWKIYPKLDYDKLRQDSGANGVWLNITDKVLSE